VATATGGLEAIQAVQRHRPDLVVLGDEQRLHQVLANLVDNALRHTPAGLTSDQAERVFERFYRADPARSGADGGTGLGLSSRGRLVAVHDGTVQVDSVPGRGARFRVVLRLAPDAAG
jgi:two-component system, OmpR family, sensor kinase